MKARLFAQVVSLEARTKFSYRVDFWINAILSFGVEMLVAWYMWAAIFEASGAQEIGGRTFPAMVLYYITVLLIGRFAGGRDFEGTVQGDIYEGGLNRYLVLPVAYRPYKYAQSIGKLVPVAVQVGVFAVVSVWLFDVAGEAKVSAGSVAMAVGAVLVANLLHFFMLFPLQIVAFWADNVWSLMVAHRFLSGILGGKMLPLAMFPVWALPVLEYLPFRFFFDFPARVLLGEIGLVEWALGMALGLGWCAVFAVIGHWIWRRGLHQYSGVGI